MRLLPPTAFRRAGLLLAAVALVAPSARAGELRNFDDAALNAVQFVGLGGEEPREGWAVGDEGVIWHTIDGGRNWERQHSGVRASLRSVHFLNPYTGWVVGREETADGGSSGVLLFTRDNGCKWERVLLNTLPGLNRVCFADDKNGYLLGDGTANYPSGVFVTHDSGQHWQTVPGPRCPSWLAGDCDKEAGAALVGAWNRQATVRHGRVYSVQSDEMGGRNLRGLQVRGKDAVAVGQGGLVLLSEGTQGSSWRFVNLRLPPGVQQDWDFHSVHGTGAHIWAVGRPGSAALHSVDGGRSWQIQPTGQPLPLNAIFFSDERHGWAVGELGSILATVDGGKSWEVQRRGGQRAAALFVHARGDSIPLDTVALIGGHEGYLTAGLRVTAPDPATAAPERATDVDRFRAAVRQAGGAAAEVLWMFPVASHVARAPRADLLAAWDHLHEDRAAEELLRQLVLALRTWRPDVVLTDAADGSSGFAADALLAEAARVALDKAGDPRAFPEQLTALGLQPWKAAKLYGPGKGSIVVNLTGPSIPLDSTPRDFASGPAALLAGGPVALPAERGYRLLASTVEGAGGHTRLMDGVNLEPGGVARRQLPPSSVPEAEALRAIQKRSNMRAIAEAPASRLTDGNRLLAQVGPLLADMPADHAAVAAHAVASQYARQGQWILAREAYLLLVTRYPAHPLALDACRWLVRHNSSSEARHRYNLGQFVAVHQKEFGVVRPPDAAPPARAGADAVPLPQGFEPKPDPKPRAPHGKPKPAVPPAAGRKPQQPPPPTPDIGARQTGGQVPFQYEDDARKWYQGSLVLEGQLEMMGPLFATDPSMQFCLQAARRNLGDYKAALDWYKHFAAKHPDGPWRSAALAELWLANRAGPSPKPVIYCRRTDTRPFLDGRLDDACWQDGRPFLLQDAAGPKPAPPGRPRGQFVEEYPTEARLAYDNEYLYLAVRCVHPTGHQVPTVKGRVRDSVLRGQDRVSVLLDLDRDYATCYHLQVDQRGCVCEDCWGDKTWDPRWFVSVHSGPTDWVVEAAIPLAALTADGVSSGKAWAANVVRVLPGRGVQALSLPAEVPEEALRPEGMGLLLFTAPTGPVSAIMPGMPGAQ